MTNPFGDPGPVVGNPVDEPDRPSSLGYWLGGLLIAVGIIGSAAWGIVNGIGFSDAIDDFERVPVGQIGRVQLDQGDYVVYAERGGGPPEANFLSGVRMRPAGEGRDEEIVFEDYTSDFTYEIGGRTGRAQLTFRIDDAGEHRVRVEDGPGTTATTAAFGPSVAGDLLKAVLGAFAIAVGGVVVGVILIIVTGLRRRRFRRRTWMDGAAGTAFGTTPPSPPGGGYPPPPV